MSLLDVSVDMRLRDSEGRRLAVADLADEPDVGTGMSVTDALHGALAAFPDLRESLAARGLASLS